MALHSYKWDYNEAISQSELLWAKTVFVDNPIELQLCLP